VGQSGKGCREVREGGGGGEVGGGRVGGRGVRWGGQEKGGQR